MGYTAARKGNRAIGALHLGYNRNGRLEYAGKVGTGFTIQSAKGIYDKLSKLEVKEPAVENVPRSVVRLAHWVKPALLCEVEFTEWTDDGHVRHPSFQGLREDKRPQEVVMEMPVKVTSRSPAKNHKGTKRDDPLEVAGVAISHPDRVVFSDVDVTKGLLAEYYATVSPWLMKDIAFHPLTLLRCPEGMSGQCFYQRSPGMGLGSAVKPFHWKHKGKSYNYLYIEDEKGLVELAQMGVIELHPWGSRVDSIDYRDRLVFDLDPDEGIPVDALKLAARDLRQRLARKGLDCFLKCTGGKGLHITVPLDGKTRWDEAKEFCASIAEEMVHDVPSAYIATMAKAKRKGKIFVDYFRNDYAATAIADFSVRARPNAPVAVPLEWRELSTLLAPNQFTLRDVLKRVRKNPPSTARYEKKQKLPL